MSEESRVEAAPQPQGQVLTLRRVKGALVGQLCLVLFLSSYGLYLLFHGGHIPAIICCVGAVVRAGFVPAFWKQYRRVRSGAIVIVQPQITSQLVRVHPAAAILLTSLMTLMVLALGGVTLYILPSLTRVIRIQAFLVGFNLLLWFLTSFFWYRVATERQKITVVEPFYEQGEGVWPPAPQVPKIK